MEASNVSIAYYLDFMHKINF